MTLGKQLLSKAGDRDEEENEGLWRNDVEKSNQVGCLDEVKGWSASGKAFLGIFVAFLFLFPYISIFVLFGMVAKLQDDDDSTGSSLVTVDFPYSSSASSSSYNTAVSAGKGGSLLGDGELQMGGGTSIYLNTTSITTYCPSYLNLDAVYENAYLVSYANEDSSNSTLQVVEITSPTTGVVMQSMATDYYLYETVSLTTDGLFVGIAQDSNPDLDTSYVVAGTVDSSNGYAISLSSSPPEYSTEDYEINSLITRLSDSSFAIAYFCQNSTAICTKYGNVVKSTLSVTLSSETVFVFNSHYSVQPSIVGMSDSQYLLMYYDSNITETPNPTPGPLNAILATVPTPTDTLPAPTLGDTSTLSSSEVNFYFKATRLTDDTAVVVYVDPSINYGIKCQVVKLINSAIVFGASWTANSGQALEELSPYEFMDLDVVTTSTANSFMILYSDVRNLGAMTATSAVLTYSGEIVRSSPDFVLSGSNTGGAYAWGSLASGVLTPTASQTAILTAFTGTDCSVAASTSFALMEIKPLPIGVVDSTSSSAASVIVSGSVTAGVSFAAPAGKAIYTNSMGDIFVGSNFYGSLPSSSSLSSSGTNYHYYVVDRASNALVSQLDSRIGVLMTNSSYLVVDQGV